MIPAVCGVRICERSLHAAMLLNVARGFWAFGTSAPFRSGTWRREKGGFRFLTLTAATSREAVRRIPGTLVRAMSKLSLSPHAFEGPRFARRWGLTTSRARTALSL